MDKSNFEEMMATYERAVVYSSDKYTDDIKAICIQLYTMQLNSMRSGKQEKGFSAAKHKAEKLYREIIDKKEVKLNVLQTDKTVLRKLKKAGYATVREILEAGKYEVVYKAKLSHAEEQQLEDILICQFNASF